MKFRIAILECDTPLDRTKKIFGGYGGVFKQLFEEACRASGYSEDILDFTTVSAEKSEEFPSLENIDAIVLTGSKYTAYDDEPWIIRLTEFTKKCLDDKRVRVIGVCFGHQIVGRALQVPLGRSDKGWEVSVVPLELTEVGRKVFKTNGLSLFQMHQDIVLECPEGVELLASSLKCQYQGFHKPRKLITVQSHPEFTYDIVKELLDYRQEHGIFPDGIYDDGVRRLREHDDGIIVGQAFLNFLQE